MNIPFWKRNVYILRPSSTSCHTLQISSAFCAFCGLNSLMPGIGLLNEKPLHASLKQWYARPGDQFEVPVGGFVIDIVRDDLLIEIQTRNFSSIKSKLNKLAHSHRVRLI